MTTLSPIAARMREIAAEPVKGLDVLALDVASKTGFARGRFGETPRCGSIRFASEGASANAIFAGAFDWMVDYTKDNDVPDILILEATLPSTFVRGRTTKRTNDVLLGLHGVIRAVAYKRRIFDIRTVAASDVRRHFLDINAVKREDAKRLVVRKCRALGWLSEADDDDADAAATIQAFFFIVSLFLSRDRDNGGTNGTSYKDDVPDVLLSP